MDEEEKVDVVEYVENDEVRKHLQTPSEVRQVVYEAMSELVDSTALQGARRLMSSPETPDGIRANFILGWLAHRRANKELMHRIASGSGNEGISFTFNVGTDAEVQSVNRVKQAFGVGEETEDADVQRDE